ncbi:MAG: hypothetical protein D6694_08120, partial [Gammaproteobacteria bacterium]
MPGTLTDQAGQMGGLKVSELKCASEQRCKLDRFWGPSLGTAVSIDQGDSNKFKANFSFYFSWLIR